MSNTAVERINAALSGRYRIERQLGEGGMATVYLAEDLRHQRQVAIKVLKPELAAVLGAERFIQEITTTAQLQHPHILPLFDSGAADGFLFYVMPYIEGETLRDRMDREKHLSVDEGVRIAREVADALDYAHRRGVIHRDIKPENILLHDGRPMVADFGIALAVSAAAGGRMTETGMSLGTPYYMSPEQATAEKDLTGRSDVYSLASVLYEMLAGDPPHMGSSAQQIILRIITDEARPLGDVRKSVPENVATAVARGLEKLPADRFDTAREFADALSDPTFTTVAAGASAGARATPGRRSRALVASLAATTLVATLLAAWGWLRPQPKLVARYGLALPADRAVMTHEFSQLSLAPDGSWLVYRGPADGPGQTQLWVKARDVLEATPIPGTTGAFSPSVSPDGAWIAFTLAGQLRRVPAVGGSAVTIADSVSWGQSLWMEDGTVVYADGLWRLRRVPAGGGTSEVLFTPELGRYAAPLAPLPGGRGLLFIHCDNNCTATSELWVADSRSGTTKMLLPEVSWATYADGRLLFVRQDGAVLGVPLDLATFELGGAPVPLLDGVTVGTTAQVTRSASGTLAYLAGGDEGYLNEVVWVSRDGGAVPVDPDWVFRPSNNTGWALSPDGTRLALSAVDEAGTENVWIKELDRGPASRLTFSDLQDIRPRWAPDGRAVTFLSDRAGDFDLYRRSADGTGTDSLVLHLEAPILEAILSSDGQWIVMRTGGQDNLRDIVALRVGEDTVPRPLLTAPYDEEAPALSPDGRWLAYVSTETGQREVFVRPFPDVEAGKWQVSTGGGVSPVWAHSGRELLFVDGARQMVSQEVLPGAVFQRGGQRVLFSVDRYRQTENISFFDPSPDDQRFLMVRPQEEIAGGGSERSAPVLVIVENWLDEVDRIMSRGSR
jgi:Tol biopolymer transport system component